MRQAQTITPTYQTQTGVGRDGGGIGNCMVAAIATITGTPLPDIPHFVEAYLDAAHLTVGHMAGDDWLNVLNEVQVWLDSNSFDSIESRRIESADVAYGSRVHLCLALVMSTLNDSGAPHIIVTDQRGVQVWDPNPAALGPYAPTDVLALLMVSPRL